MVLYWNINSNYVDQSLEWSLYITSMSRPISALFTGAKNSINSRVRQAWKGSNHKQRKNLKVVVMSKIYKMVKMVKCLQIALQSFRSSCTLQEPVLWLMREELFKKAEHHLKNIPFFLVEWCLLHKKCPCSSTVSCTHRTKTMCINRLILTG